MSRNNIAAVRAFNRFYTRQLGLLDQIILDSPYSLTEARVLYELAQDATNATDIAAALGLDAGYLSRTLRAFADKGLITRRAAPADKRQSTIALTAKGRLAYGRLDKASHAEIEAMLARSGRHANRIVEAMATIENGLGGQTRPQPALRAPEPGDIGWVIRSQAQIYARDYGFDATFEGLVADIAGAFLQKHDPARERCWIAAWDDQPVGSVFLMRHSDEVAKLRLLVVADEGRGLGLGRQLTDEVIAFARACGYAKISLWTQSILLAARKIYQDAGFTLVATEPHRSFGQDLIGETWELRL